jgi:hypothetical protein
MKKAAKTPNRPRPSRITVPRKANPLAKLVFSEMARQNVTYFELEMRSGILTSTFKAWRTDNAPGLASIQATLGALGWTLVPVPNIETLSDDVRAALEEIAQHFRSDEEALGAAITSAAAWPSYAKSVQARTLTPGYGTAPAALVKKSPNLAQAAAA